MKPRITEKQLGRFYRLLSAKMIDFDCGKICAPKNDGIPYCCDNVSCVPILFREEFNWHQKNGKFWKRMPPVNKRIKKYIDESEDYYVFSKCPGVAGCKRTKRSLNCMMFPFEPYVNKKGEVLGLTQIDGDASDCPLTRKPKNAFNPLYISNSIKFWKELFELYPEEEELYINETKKRERRAKRKGKKLRIFREG
jgi:hypothetical protein